MALANPTMRARVGADALASLVQDVRRGRAQWTHAQHLRQSTDELVRAAEAITAVVGEMTSAMTRIHGTGPHSQQATQALQQALQGATTAAAQLRAARRFMH